MPIKFGRVYPILRIFSEAKAREFYLDYLGFEIEWQHRFDEQAPLFMQVKRGDLVLRLSEHHGDSCPGMHVTIDLVGVDELHQELTAKKNILLCGLVWKKPNGIPAK